MTVNPTSAGSSIVRVSRLLESHGDGVRLILSTAVMPKAAKSSVLEDGEVPTRGGGVASLPTTGPVKWMKLSKKSQTG